MRNIKDRDTMPEVILMLHPKDNVVIALKQLNKGDKVQGKDIGELEVLDDTPKSHKIALKDIARGEEIIKYGEVIAVSSEDIKKGQWVHTHNLKSDTWKK